MKRIITILAVVVFGIANLKAQVSVSVGPDYSQQSYYTLSSDATSVLENTSWDLAFSTGFGQVGILINESATYGANPVSVYDALTDDFSTIFNPDDLTDRLYNAQDRWENGALNEAKDPNIQFDMGWGTYDPLTHNINGSRVYAIQLRNGTWKKLKIVSLAMGEYTIKYADIDGSNEVTKTIKKNDFSSPFAYFSFSTETTTASPSNWDLFFGRYSTPLNAGGSIVDYTVAGVLTAPGVNVAANAINPNTVNYEDYLDSLTEQIDVIGHDWKDIDFTVSPPAWVVAVDRAYFVKTTDNHLWKIDFLDFEGKSTGVCVFNKTDLGVVASLSNPTSNFQSASVFPNPIADNFTVSFELKETRTNLNITIINNLGQTVWSAKTNGKAGLNILNLQTPTTILGGTYHIIIGNNDDITTQTLIFK